MSFINQTRILSVLMFVFVCIIGCSRDVVRLNNRSGYESSHHPNSCLYFKIKQALIFQDVGYFNGLYLSQKEQTKQDVAMIHSAIDTKSLSIKLLYSDGKEKRNPGLVYENNWQEEKAHPNSSKEIELYIKYLNARGVECFCRDVWALYEYEIKRPVNSGTIGFLNIKTDTYDLSYKIKFVDYEWKIIEFSNTVTKAGE